MQKVATDVPFLLHPLSTRPLILEVGVADPVASTPPARRRRSSGGHGALSSAGAEQRQAVDSSVALPLLHRLVLLGARQQRLLDPAALLQAPSADPGLQGRGGGNNPSLMR